MFTNTLVKQSLKQENQKASGFDHTEQDSCYLHHYLSLKIENPPSSINLLQESLELSIEPCLQSSNIFEKAELQKLKQQISSIQSTAMKQILTLKNSLLQQKQSKKQLLKEIQLLKLQNKNIASSEFLSNQNEQLALVKEQNKMIKQALKKQLEINRFLMKQNLMSQTSNQTPVQNKENNKENYYCQTNSALPENQQIPNVLNSSTAYHKLTIPMPSYNKKNQLRC